MTDWTSEQRLAIDKEGTNILVSAGAGSGKTAVLSERVIRKLHDGVNIDEILILTFTNAAAYEMMIRIRENIKSEGLAEQLDLIDKAYITTFDSFTGSIVKKYHDRLNIDRNFKIIDENTMNLVRENILDEIFSKYYLSNNSLFLKLIKDFCDKKDDTLKGYILDIDSKLDLKYDKKEYLDNYISNYFNDTYIDNLIIEYEKLLRDKIKIIETGLSSLSLILDGDYIATLEDILAPLLNSNTYDEVKANNYITISKPSLPRNSGTEASEIKKNMSKEITAIKEMTKYSKDELKNIYKETKDYTEIVITILKELDKKINKYKLSHNTFEFIDIEKLAIELVKNNDDIREELTNSFKEIMVDEYQDTSDLQEELISLISNNNNYMVGDIKQSIYRFRNANPKIFKDKYSKFENEDGGIKIDLTNNFRSRSEVLLDINEIFNQVMSISFGGADYLESHQLIPGNKTYSNEGSTNQDYNLAIKDYTIDKESLYKDKDEIEAFIIAKDIKDKVDNKYQIFNPKTKEFHDARYNDFTILINASTKFTLYKKIFEYLGIPLTLLRDVDISKEEEISIIKNILKLIIKEKVNLHDDTFRYAYISIARSYLFRLSDEEIFERLESNNYDNDIILTKVKNIVDKIDLLDLKNILINVIDEFNFYEKIITVGNISLRTTILDKMVKLAEELNSIDYDINIFIDYLDNILSDKDKKIKVEIAVADADSVKIMTIHKSKGLEYPICYYPGLSNKFNIQDLNARILYDNKYGIVFPINKDGYQDTFIKDLVKDNYIFEEISERIRLFYVALTRCKEKMIIVANLNDNDIDDINDVTKGNYRKFLDIINSVKSRLTNYIEEVDLNTIGLTRDYLTGNIERELKEFDKVDLDVKELEIEESIVEDKHFSKTIKSLITKEQKSNMEFGTSVHELFEIIDFKNPRLDELNIDDNLKKYINNLLSQDILKNINDANILKEYEFYYEVDNETKHGIIDLMLEYSDHIDIIDYKLKNVDDLAYLEQLNGYKKYIESKTNKKVNIYLYSILNNSLKSLG